MFREPLPPRLRLLAVTVVIVAAVSAGATLPLISSASSSVSGVASGAHPSTIDAKEARGASGSGLGPGGALPTPDPVGGPVLTYGVVATVALPTGSAPDGVAADSVNGNVYVTESNHDNVTVINGTTQKVVTAVPVGSNPSGIVFNSVNSEVYVANLFGDDVRVINTTTNTVVANISVPNWPVGLACDSVNGDVYVTQQTGDTVSVIAGSGPNVNTIIATMSVGRHPIADAFDAATGDVYVANSGTSNVSVIDAATNTVTGTIPVGSHPFGVAYDSGNGDVYVTNGYSNNTTVISGTTVVTSVSVGAYPVGVAYDPVHMVIGVAAQDAGQVNFIANATNARVANVTVGSKPVGIAYNPFNHYEYVTNANSSNVSVIGTAIAPPYPVTFSETGLPTGTSWSVTLAGTTQHSTTGSIVFSETNGSYSYTVGAVPEFVATPSAGQVVVDGFPVMEAILFAPPMYPVTFTERGLPTGTAWAVTLNGTPSKSTISTVTFNETNGTYPYVVAAVGFTAAPSSGTVTVNGAPAFVAITFTTPGVSTYSVVFTESGLASGTTWVVNLSGTPQSSTTSSLAFILPNGSYPYKVEAVTGYTASPTSGTVNVTGASTAVSVTFTSTSGTKSSTTGSGTPWWVFAVIAVVIIAVVVGVVMFLRRRPPARPAPAPPPSGTPGTQP